MRYLSACAAVAILCGGLRADDVEAVAAEWAASAGGRVERDETAPGKPVVAVSFGPLNKKITNDGLKHLKGFANLKTLSLFFLDQIGDDGMKHVRGLTKLETLVLGNTAVTDAGLAELKGLKLKSLTVSGCIAMTDKCTETIKGFTDLDYLSLPSTITEKGVKNLIGLKKLTGLYIGGANLTDAAVKDIADHMPELALLDLAAFAGTDITDASVPHLARLKKLKKLSLAGAKLTAGGVKTLREKLPGCTITVK